MTQLRCSNCNTVFTLPRGQGNPKKCGVCGKGGTLSLVEPTWACAACGTANGVAKTACQGCRLERVTRTTPDGGGRRPPPPGDHQSFPRDRIREGVVKSTISDGD